MSALSLSILTPEGKAFEGEIGNVVLPGTEGAFAVFPGHAPLISALETGLVRVAQTGKHSYFIIRGGFVEVRENAIAVLADSVEPAENAQQGKQRLSLLLAPTRPSTSEAHA